MNCKSFERDLSDWIAGRLPDTVAARMTAHTAACEACSRQAEGERTLRAAWRELPPLGEAPDLWPQLAARISEPREVRAGRPAWLRWLPEIGPSLKYGLAGVAAAMALATVVMSRPPANMTNTGPAQPPIVRNVPQADEGDVIRLVSDRQATLPEAEGDLRIMGTARYREAERYALGVGSAQ
jgi:anti-sigma factor RsiW